jgi:uncharacterized protein HemX
VAAFGDYIMLLNVDRRKGEMEMKKSLALLLLIVAVGVFLSSGCTEKKETTAEDVKRETKEAARTVKAYTEEQRAKYMADVNNKLKSYEEEIQSLETRAADMKDEARMAMEKRLQTLREKRDGMSERLDEMKSAGGDAWMEMKKGMDKAMGEMSKAYEKAAAEFE